MSIYKKLISAAGIFTITTAMLTGVTATALSGSVEAPTSNSSFTYCNFNNFYAVSDVEAARQISGDKAYFYVTENTNLNVVNGKCVANIVANYVPYIVGHKTTFDISNFGSVTNVKVLNVNPELLSVTCDGNNTVFRFKDANTDKLTYNTIVGNNDFNTPTTSQESDNVLKVTMERKNSNYTGSNNVTLYIDEVAITGLSAGYKSMNTTASAVAYTGVDVTVDKNVSTSKLSVTVKGVCDSSLYATSSSSSMMSSSSSSMMSSSSSMMMSSSSMAMSSASMKNAMTKTDTTTDYVASGKGMLTRTGGSN